MSGPLPGREFEVALDQYMWQMYIGPGAANCSSNSKSESGSESDKSTNKLQPDNLRVVLTPGKCSTDTWFNDVHGFFGPGSVVGG